MRACLRAAAAAAFAFPLLASATIVQTLTAGGEAELHRVIQAGAPPDSRAAHR